MDTIPMTEYDVRSHALRSIGRAADAVRESHARSIRAISWFLSVSILAAILNQLGLKTPLTGHEWLDVVVNVAAGLIAGLVAYWLGPDPTESRDRLDGLLAAYEPVDQKAYAGLQTALRERHEIEPELVIKWIQTEVSALRQASGAGLPSLPRFLNKPTNSSGRDNVAPPHIQQAKEAK